MANKQQRKRKATVTSKSGGGIKNKPQPKDVLLGRGSGSNKFQGNITFRNWADEMRQDYIKANKYAEKDRISKALFRKVHANGGRFLQLTFKGNKDQWVIAPRDVALEKCKQILREKRQKAPKNGNQERVTPETAQSNDNIDEEISATQSLDSDKDFSFSSDMASLEGDYAADASPSSAVVESSPLSRTLVDGASASPSDSSSLLHSSPVQQQDETYAPQVPFSSVLPSTLPGSAGYSTVPLNARHSPYGYSQQTIPQFRQTHEGQTIVTCYINGTADQAIDYMHQRRRGMTLASDCSRVASPGQQMESFLSSRFMPPMVPVRPDEKPRSSSSEKGPGDNEDLTPLPKDAPVQEENGGEELLSLLSLSNRQVLTEEQEQRERASLTDEERTEALSDMFGQMSIVDTRPDKRCKRDLDRDSLQFLIGQMRLELKQIPNHEKQALEEAQSRAHPSEFSDDRLLVFLRCEGMNVKLAAQHFVNYWNGRLEVFGKDKFCMRMRLSEALRDDLVALEAGVIIHLPFPDLSGRQLIYAEPRRHTREGYSSESMQRALWYTIETVAQSNTSVDGSIVQVLWDAETSMFDYDSKLHDRVNYFRDNAWPVRLAALHTCCSPPFVVHILKPILMALKSKTTRSRTMFHNVPQDEILDVLSNYGILPTMLPTEMGGTLVLNQREWIANRWAIEMEMDEI